MVGDSGFGYWLEDMATAMQALALLELGSVLAVAPGSHDMSVRIERKLDSGREIFCVSCHDANGDPKGTGRHIRFEAYTPQQLRKRSLRECFVRFDTYFPGSMPGFRNVTAICLDVHLKPPENLAYFQLPPGPLAPKQLEVAIAGAIEEHIPQLLRSLCLKLKAAGVVPEEAVQPLQGLNVEGQPALATAAMYGHPGAFTSFATNALQILEIEGPAAVELLVAEATDGKTALEISTQRRCPGVFEDMARALRLGRATEKEIVNALKKASAKRESPLAESAYEGHLDAFVDMGRATKTARLGDEAADDLMLGLTRGGTSALGVAVVRRHQGAFMAFARGLLERGRVGDAAVRMFQHPGIGNMTPIELARRVGYPNADDEYAKALDLVKKGPPQP